VGNSERSGELSKGCVATRRVVHSPSGPQPIFYEGEGLGGGAAGLWTFPWGFSGTFAVPGDAFPARSGGPGCRGGGDKPHPHGNVDPFRFRFLGLGEKAFPRGYP